MGSKKIRLTESDDPLEIFAVNSRAVASFESAQKESWRINEKFECQTGLYREESYLTE